MDLEKVGDWIESHVEAMVELQAGLTSRPALGPENGGTGEWEKARFLEAYLLEHGFGEAEHYDCPDERVPEGTRPNFVVRQVMYRKRSLFLTQHCVPISSIKNRVSVMTHCLKRRISVLSVNLSTIIHMGLIWR